MSDIFEEAQKTVNDIDVDTVTGFYTHDKTFVKIKEYIKGQGANGTHALISLDLINLNAVNNVLGYEFGNEIISNCADIIRDTANKDDIIGRVGGDEILLFSKNCGDKENVESFVAALVDKLCVEYTHNEKSMVVLMCAGVSIYGIDGTDVGDLYLKADAALYYAKKESDKKYALYGKHIKPEDIRAEEKKSLISLRTLLEYMDGGVILTEVGEDLDIYYASPSFYKMSHRTTAEAGEKGENLMSVVVPEDRKKVLDTAKKIAKTGESIGFVYRVYESDGSIGWRQVRAARLPGLRSSGNRALICVITNVTQIKESDATLEAIVENSPAGICVFEVGSSYVRPTLYNHTLEKMLGISAENKENVQLNAILDRIDTNQRQHVCDEIVNAVHESRMSEVEFKIHDGSETRYISARGINLYKQNKKTYVLVVFTDITKEYKLRKQIRFEQDRYRIAVDLTNAVLWEVDIKTKTVYQYSNNEAKDQPNVRIYENAPQSIVEADYIHPDFTEEYLRMFENLYNGNDSGDYFYKRRDENDEYIWVKSKFRLLRDDNGEIFYSVGIAEKVLNIDTQMRRFEQEQYFCDQVANSVLSSIKINISKNIIERHYVAASSQKLSNNQHSYDALLNRSVPIVSIKEDIDNLMQKLSRENLFALFRNGQDWLNVEFRRRDKQDKIRWTSLAMSLLRHPVSGDLYGFAYVRDVDKRRRWELSLPSKVERDAVSMIYNSTTAFNMINTILPSVKDKKSYCAMCMLDIDGLDAIQAEKGEYMVQNILFTIGRVLRIIVDGSAIVGQIDNRRIMIFRVGIGSAEEQFLRVEYSVERLLAMIRMTFPNEVLNIYNGVAITRISNANLRDMYDEAYHACSEAIMKNVKIVKVEIPDKESESYEEILPVQIGRQRDQQTGLMTRQDYYDTFRKLRPETLSSLGVFIADINGLRTINHRYGMEYGDRIIKTVAANLLKQFGEDEVYRVSGDEFLVLCKDCTQDSFINRCDKVIDLIGNTYKNIISVGTTWDSHISNVQSLIDHADEMMKNAKQEYYHMSNTVPTGSDYKTYMWVMDAIKDSRFVVQLQPKAELANGNVTSCEALVRYIDAESGMVHPARFIAILERENVIKQLDFYVLNKALDIIDGWIKAGKAPVSVSVNFSRRTLLAPGSLKEVMEAVKDREYLLEHLCIEITETIGSMERAMVTRVCEMFQKAGIKLALDDFGSEYSNLYIVSALRFDEIKIDKSVIDDIVTNDLARLTVENTKRICERTGATLVAEGVGTEEQMNILKDIGCHMAQGYHINKPLSLKEFTDRYIK